MLIMENRDKSSISTDFKDLATDFMIGSTWYAVILQKKIQGSSMKNSELRVMKKS